MTGEVYYRVVPVPGGWWKVQTWRWWWPFWITSVDYFSNEERCAEWIKGHSTYYDGAL